MFKSKNKKKMYTPVNPIFTLLKWGVRGYKSHGHVILMINRRHYCIDEHVLDAFIQRYCLHGISCTLYNFKQQKKNVTIFLKLIHASRPSLTNFHKAGQLQLINRALCKVYLQYAIVNQRVVKRQRLTAHDQKEDKRYNLLRQFQIALINKSFVRTL